MSPLNDLPLNEVKSSSAVLPPPPPKEDQEKCLRHGPLEKYTTTAAIPGFKSRYVCVSTSALSYYTSHVASSWGVVPLDERGVVPGELIVSIRERDGDKTGREFVVEVTNFENNRYPGRNHSRKDGNIAKEYRFRASGKEDRDEWIKAVKAIKGGGGGLATSGISRTKTSSNRKTPHLFKTNLGRLMRSGDDWTDVAAMSLSDMIAVRDAELNEAKSSRLYVKFEVKGGGGETHLAQKGGNIKDGGNEIVKGVEEEKDIMRNDKRHNTLAPELNGKGGCGCVVS